MTMANKFDKALNTNPKARKKPRKRRVFGAFEVSTPSGTRTLDTLIKSQVLYQLS